MHNCLERVYVVLFMIKNICIGFMEEIIVMGIIITYY